MKHSVFGRREALWALCAALIATGFAAVATPRTEEAFTIKRIFVKGETNLARLSSELQVAQDEKKPDKLTNVKLGLILRETTLDIKEDGAMVIRMDFPKGAADLGTGDIDIRGLLPIVTKTFDKSGRVVKEERDNANGPFGSPDRLVALAALGFYPEKPVKIGESWDIEVDDPDKKDTRRKIGKATLVGIETLKGMETFKIKWVIDIERTENGKEKKSHIEAEANIDRKSGRNVRVKGKASGALEMGIRNAMVTFDLLNEKEIKELGSLE
jgi:hypothetical protein